MVKTTPFFPRTDALNETRLWEHWAGYLVARKYQYSEMSEYYAVRNSVGLFDTSPLFKYKIAGSDATRFLSGVLARDVRRCPVGKAQYTIWCDDDGWMIEDGVVLHVADDEYYLTCAEPDLRYLRQLIAYRDVTVTDVSERYGILAVQGPHSRSVLGMLSQEVGELRYFDLIQTQIGEAQVLISRTGYTGDLGYEVWVPSEHALAVWDAIMEAGAGYNITPFGQIVLHMARIDAGLILIDADYHSARHAWTDEQRSDPIEMGFDWMFRQLAKDSRAFIGRSAIERTLESCSSRWTLTGIEVDWQAHERLYNRLGMIAPKDHLPIEEAMSLYAPSPTSERRWRGHTTSFAYSSILKKHVGLAKIAPACAAEGTELQLELMINDRPRLVDARVVSLPFYRPEHKTK